MKGSLQVRLGHHLRAHRVAMGLSQEQFAVFLDVHRTYMGALERGERNVTLKTVETIASKLGVDPVELLAQPDQD